MSDFCRRSADALPYLERKPQSDVSIQLVEKIGVVSKSIGEISINAKAY